MLALIHPIIFNWLCYLCILRKFLKQINLTNFDITKPHYVSLLRVPNRVLQSRYPNQNFPPSCNPEDFYWRILILTIIFSYLLNSIKKAFIKVYCIQMEPYKFVMVMTGEIFIVYFLAFWKQLFLYSYSSLIGQSCKFGQSLNKASWGAFW